MKLSKILFSALVILLCAGCACKSKRVGPGDDNIPMADAGSVLKDINYAFDSYAIDATARAVLDANSSYLAENTGVKVQVEGHCDERGTNEYNMVLGANRAKAAYDYLRAKGIDAARLSTVSYGEELPLDPAHNEVAWAKNRRAHFAVQN